MKRLQTRVMEFKLKKQNTSIQYFHHLIPEKTTKSKLDKKLAGVEKYIIIYEQYIRLLLGTDMEFTTSKMNVKNEDTDLGLPEAIISLPNPDYIPDEYDCPLRQLEIFEQIVKSLQINENSVHDKLFAKAIESVFTHLADRKTFSLFDLKARGVETSHQKHSSNQLGTAQQLLSKYPARSPISVIMEEVVYHQEDLVYNLVTKFRKYITENFFKNQTSTQNITDYLQTNITKLVYVQKKAYSQGEYLKNVSGKWVKTRNETSDLLTLVRNCLIIQLSRKGFIIKQFVSSTGDAIYLQLHMPEKMLEIAAENFRLNKKLSFSLTDLLSLEPVDKQFRPLRLNGRLWKHDEYNNSSYLEYLRPLIIDQIQQINFKRLATEVGQSGINVQLFEYGKNDLHGDQEGPTEDEWTAYYKYLVHLNKQVQIQRQNYRIDNDLALCYISGKPIEELYMLRKFQRRKGIARMSRTSVISTGNELTEQDIERVKQLKNELNAWQQDKESLKLLTGLPTLKKVKVVRQQQLAHNYQQIFKEAIKVANCTQQYLKTIWDRIGQQPFELFQTYSNNIYRKRISQKAKQQLRWCRYIKNEKNQLTLFPAHERLKLAYSVISSTININTLIQLKLVNSMFCLHDKFELFGHCQSILKAVSKESQYYKRKMFDLSSEWNLNAQQPWITPTEKICFYFGEKIGLYFEYNSFFIKHAAPMAIMGIIFSILLFSIGDFQSETYINIMVFCSFVIIHWNSFNTEYWNQQQLTFNLKFGQRMDVKENLVRTTFKGQRTRSIETDDLNAIEIDTLQYFTRLAFSIMILLLLIGTNISIIIGLYYLNLYLKEQLGESYTAFYLEIIITAALNYVIQLIFDLFYEKVCLLLTDFENFKTSQEYETSFIIKKYILYCFAYVVPLLAINFLNTQLQLYCAYENCQHHVQYYYGTTTMLMFIYQAIKLLQLFLFNKNKLEVKRYSNTEEDRQSFIESQDKRIPFQKSMELYGIQEEYMQFFVFLTLINIFGYIFPFSITLLWIWSVIQVQIQKYKLLFLFQRPWPKNEGSLGIWLGFSQIVNYISLLSNTGMITIYYKVKLEEDLIMFFVILILFNFMVKFAIYQMFGNTPMTLELIIRRSKYILHSNVNLQGTSRSSKKQQKSEIQRIPLYKIFGSQYESRVGNFETISSDDEIQDYYVHTSKQNNIKGYKLNEPQSKSEANNSISKRKKKPQSKITSHNSKNKISNSNGFIEDQEMEFSWNLENEQDRIESKARSFRLDMEKKDSIINEKDNKILNMKQDVLTMKDIQLSVKNLNDVNKLDYKFLNHYYQNRATNFQFQINLGGKKTQKKIRTNIYRFFLHLNLLTKYNMIWTDYRIVTTQYYMKRKHLLLHNLDYRRYEILKNSFDRCNEQSQDEAMVKYRKQLQKFGNTLTLDEVNEYNELLSKFHNCIEKKTWLKSRKVVIFRFKGIFFRGFRKQTVRKSSLKYVCEYYAAMKRLAQTQFESELHKQFNSLVSHQSLNQYDLNQFLDLFNQLNYEQKQTYFMPASNKRVNQKVYHTQFLKSEFYRNVIDKSKDTYIFEQQQSKVEEFVQQYFLDEINPIPNMKIQKHLHDILWIVKLEDGQEYLMQFFQVKHGQSLTFQKYHNDDLGLYFGESKNYIKLPNLLDQIDDFFIKGYCVSLYKGRNFKSLFQVLQFRNKYSIHYTLEELKKFLYANLILLTKKTFTLSIYNYILINNEYMILNSIIDSTSDPVHSLVQVIVEMILLHPVDDLIKALQTLDHPFRYFLKDIIYEGKSPKQILERMIDQKRFQEIDFQMAPVVKEIQFHDFLENMKHQINFCLRMKQFQKCLLLIIETEEQIRINYYQTYDELLPFFVNKFSKNLGAYILRSNDIKRVLDFLLIYHFKISALFGLRKDFDKEITLLIDGLKRCVAQLRVLFRQLSLNVKLENLSEIEQCIILKKKINKNIERQSTITSFERFSLLNTLRKNQDYIMVVIQYQTQLQRYLNQFQVIRAIDSYFNKNFILAIIQLNDVILLQEQLVTRQPTLNILDVPLDHSLGLINLDQQSPREDDQMNQDTQETGTTNLMKGDPLYGAQLLFYKFLYLVNLFDSKNETFSFYHSEFQEMNQIHPYLFDFYNNQLMLINNETLPAEKFESYRFCEIGQYHLINSYKWMEIKQQKQLNLIASSNQDFIWRQVMIFSDICPTLDNRFVIKSQISFQIPPTSPLSYQLYQVRLIIQLLHLDNYSPVSHSIQFTGQQRQAFQKQKNFCFIKLLKFHQSRISIPPESWFFQNCLDETQMFYYLSVCFTFSPKHIENLGISEPEICEHACHQIKKFQGYPKFYPQILKCLQLNNKPAETFLFDSSLSTNVQFQIFCIFFNCTIKEKQTIKGSYQKIKDHLIEDHHGSKVVLAILHSFISYQQMEIVDLLISFSSKLLESQAFIFHHPHEGFEQDLQLIQCLYQNNNNLIPLPLRQLYKYDDHLKYYEDIKFNVQYLLFNIMMNQDYFYIQEILLETIESLKLHPELIRFQHLFQSFLEVVKAMLGSIEVKNKFSLQLYDYKEGTLMYALLSHFQCKYYINLIDYETAHKFSEKVLSYIQTTTKSEGLNITFKNNNLSREYQINKTLSLFEIQDCQMLTDEIQDSDYVHLFNNDFINDAILNHVTILINIEKSLPNITILFPIQLMLENKVHQSYLQCVYARYFNYFLNQENNDLLLEQLKFQQEEKLSEVKELITTYEQKQQAYFLLKLHVLSEVTIIDQKLKILDFQLNLLLSTGGLLNKKLINNWALQCSSRAVDGYLSLVPSSTEQIHPNVSLMYLLQCQSYQFLGLLQNSQKMIDKAEFSLKAWFDDNKHPLKGLFFFYQGNHNRWLYLQYIKCIQEIIELNEFDAIEVKIIVQGLINQDYLIHKTFDYYHQNVLKKISANLNNYVFSEIGKHDRQKIYKKYKKEDARDILDDIIYISSQKDLNGISQFLDALAIFNHFETEHQCIDIIKSIITGEQVGEQVIA